MPYTLPLADLPVSWPKAQARLVDPNGAPTREFQTLLDQLRTFLDTVKPALDEVEPP